MQKPATRPVTARSTPVPGETIAAATAPQAQLRGAAADLAGEGRRTLSTAFVRIGPDGYLTVMLRDGRSMVLHAVAMERDRYCGFSATRGEKDDRFCGRYEDVADAQPGGGPSGEPLTPPIAELRAPAMSPR